MPFNVAPGLLAGGTIEPRRFVKLSTSADHTGLQCGSGEVAIGISQVGSHDTPGLTGASTYAATTGSPIQIFGLGEICLLEVGVSGFTPGAELTSDADGKGFPAAAGDNVNAIVLESLTGGGPTNKFCRVQIHRYTKHA